MDGGGRSPQQAPASTSSANGSGGSNAPKFSVYQNPSFAAAAAAVSRRPSLASLFSLVLLVVASAAVLFVASSLSAEYSAVVPDFLVKMVQYVATLVLLLMLWAFLRAMFVFLERKAPLLSNSSKKDTALSSRQLGLLGLKPKGTNSTESIKKPLKPKPTTPSEPVLPIRKSAFSFTPSRPARGIVSQSTPGSGSMAMVGTTAFVSPSVTPHKGLSSPISPWLRRSGGSANGIQTEALLDQYLANVDEELKNLAESTVTTPPPTIGGFPVVSPGNIVTSTTPGATRSAVVRPVRISPGSHQKYSTPPKKGDGELPLPMLMEDAVEAYEQLGVYPQIEEWRDRLRQWFSAMLLNPLIEKIKTSHIQVKQTASALNIMITVSQVGSDLPSVASPTSFSPLGGSRDWQPTVTVDEEGMLHQLRANLLRTRDETPSHQSFSSPQQSQYNALLPAIQACIDAITEHQRLNTLMKGELIRGLLPHSSIRTEYTVKRVQELAEGSCLKNYDYISYGSSVDKGDRKWVGELPTDSHLLLYLFAAFLEHPKWMLHVDPSSYSDAQSSKNPLFLGVLPPKDRFPEKYVAFVSGVPAIIHPGACILAVGKQSPPTFALYWDRKLQFSLQGRTALWDAILLLCHRISVHYGDVVRGVHLGSAALNLLPVIDSETENW